MSLRRQLKGQGWFVVVLVLIGSIVSRTRRTTRTIFSGDAQPMASKDAERLRLIQETLREKGLGCLGSVSS